MTTTGATQALTSRGAPFLSKLPQTISPLQAVLARRANRWTPAARLGFIAA
jgi:hypothetical protein